MPCLSFTVMILPPSSTVQESANRPTTPWSPTDFRSTSSTSYWLFFTTLYANRSPPTAFAIMVSPSAVGACSESTEAGVVATATTRTRSLVDWAREGEDAASAVTTRAATADDFSLRIEPPNIGHPPSQRLQRQQVACQG